MQISVYLLSCSVYTIQLLYKPAGGLLAKLPNVLSYSCMTNTGWPMSQCYLPICDASGGKEAAFIMRLPVHNADGPKRRKVMKTTINDRGEEVTEEVWEDSQQASPEPDQASPAASAQPQAQRAASERPHASPAASPEKSQQDDALKEQPGQFAHHNITAACRRVGTSLGV